MREVSLTEALQSLPLLANDTYMRMQAMNLTVVDALLEEFEDQLLREYFEQESMPIPTFITVSALSQLWVFGVYEVLRTWRQRVREVLQFSDAIRALDEEGRRKRLAAQKEMVEGRSADPEFVNPEHWRGFERAANDEGFRNDVQDALDRSEVFYRRLEALRVYLAKHEVPRVRGSFGTSPGYGRINMENGSVYWELEVAEKQVDVLSRRSVADSCRELGAGSPRPILPIAVRRQFRDCPREAYGIKRVILVLDDGKEYETLVAFETEVIAVPGFEQLPFDPARVIGARCRPPDAQKER